MIRKHKSRYAVLIAIALLPYGADAQPTGATSAGTSQPVTTSTPAPHPQFEAVSIRMAPPYTEAEVLSGAGNHPWNAWPSNRFTAHRLTLKLLIGISYGIDQKHIQGDPAWLDSQHYDIEAKVDGDAVLTYAQMKPLLQHLLEERFHLAVHRKTETVSGYALVVAKGGPKLRPGTEKPSTNGYIVSNAVRSPSIGMAGSHRCCRVPSATL